MDHGDGMAAVRPAGRRGRRSRTMAGPSRTTVDTTVISLDDVPQGFRVSHVGAPRRFVPDPQRMLRRRPGREPRRSERILPAIAGHVVTFLVAGLALTGCGAGQIAQTATQQAAVDGASGDAGDAIALRDVRMPPSHSPNGSYPVGSTVPVLATIINHGSEADELVAVTSPIAGRVQVSGTVRVPPRKNVVSDPDPSASPSPLVAGKLKIVLVTSHVLRPGLDTPVTFHFRNAGQVTLLVPQADPAHPTG